MAILCHYSHHDTLGIVFSFLWPIYSGKALMSLLHTNGLNYSECFFFPGFFLSLACNTLQSRSLFLIRGQIEQAKCSYFYYPQEGMVTVLHSSQQNKSFLLFWPLFAAPATKCLRNLLDNDLLETEVAMKLSSTSLGFSSKCLNKDYFNPKYKNDCIIIIIYRELFEVYTQWYIHEDIRYAHILLSKRENNCPTMTVRWHLDVHMNVGKCI